jgi:putative heme-binding domain-containing protein
MPYRVVLLAAGAAGLIVVSIGRLVAAQPPLSQDHQFYSAADIEAGARIYRAQCAQCHGTNGDLVGGIDLRKGQFRRATTNEDLAKVIANGIPGTGMPPSSMQPAEITAIVAFVRAGFDPDARPVRVGDAARGKALFEGKATCNTCHRVRGIGPRTAPDLSDIGTARAPDALHATLLDPSSRMMPINRPIRIVMKDGTTITGRRLNEDTYTVQIIDDKEQLRSLMKSEMRSYVVETKSTMPSYAKTLTADELADVIAYLLTLKG